MLSVQVSKVRKVGGQARNRNNRPDQPSKSSVPLPYDRDVGASSSPPSPPSRPRAISNVETTAVSPGSDEPTTVRNPSAPPAASRATVRTGEIVAGKFRVERVLGEGGMGVVVAATHMQLRKAVALKFLRG